MARLRLQVSGAAYSHSQYRDLSAHDLDAATLSCSRPERCVGAAATTVGAAGDCAGCIRTDDTSGSLLAVEHQLDTDREP